MIIEKTENIIAAILNKTFNTTYLVYPFTKLNIFINSITLITPLHQHLSTLKNQRCKRKTNSEHGYCYQHESQIEGSNDK